MNENLKTPEQRRAEEKEIEDEEEEVVDRTDENWGQPGHLTQDQKNALDQVKSEIKKDNDPELIGLREMDLLRFLRFRNFKVDKAMKMIRAHGEWRKSLGNTFKKEDFPSLVEDHLRGALYLAGSDRKGRPFVCIRACELFPAKFKTEELNKLIKFYTDGLFKIASETGHCEVSGLGDLENWSIQKNFSVGLVTTLLDLQANQFPETVGKIYLVNLPWTFNVALKMVRPFVDPRIMDRVTQIWTKEELYKIQEGVDPDMLEKRYGGNHEPYPLPDPIMSQLFEKKKDSTLAAEEEERTRQMALASKAYRMKKLGLAIFSISIIVLSLIGFILLGLWSHFTVSHYILFNVTFIQLASLALLRQVLFIQGLQALAIFVVLVLYVDALNFHYFHIYERRYVARIYDHTSLFLIASLCVIMASIPLNFLGMIETGSSSSTTSANVQGQNHPKKHVKIEGHRIAKDSHGRVEYKVVVESPDQKVEVWRRYNDFRQLHKRVSPSKQRLPPKAGLFRSDFDENFVQQRETELDQYLQNIVNDELISKSPSLDAFLSPSEVSSS